MQARPDQPPARLARGTRLPETVPVSPTFAGHTDPVSLERIAGSIFALAEEGIVICNARGQVVAINPAFSGITGYESDEVVGLAVRHLRSPRHETQFYAGIVRRALDEGAWRGEVWARRRQGQTFPAWLTLSAVRDGQGRPSHFIVIISDMARLSERHSHLEHMAHHDSLTGLPNRMLLLSRLDGALARSRRGNQIGAVLFLDLDFFKTINDDHGHAAGDEVLREVSRRLSRRLRESDIAARLGGDEFVILLEDIKNQEAAGDVARNVIALLQRPIALPGGGPCQIGGSVGIAIFQGDALSPEELIRRADEALFEAKKQGRGTHRYYSASDDGRRHTRAADSEAPAARARAVPNEETPGGR